MKESHVMFDQNQNQSVLTGNMNQSKLYIDSYSSSRDDLNDSITKIKVVIDNQKLSNSCLEPSNENQYFSN